MSCSPFPVRGMGFVVPRAFGVCWRRSCPSTLKRSGCRLASPMRLWLPMARSRSARPIRGWASSSPVRLSSRTRRLRQFGLLHDTRLPAVRSRRRRLLAAPVRRCGSQTRPGGVAVKHPLDFDHTKPSALDGLARRGCRGRCGSTSPSTQRSRLSNSPMTCLTEVDRLRSAPPYRSDANHPATQPGPP